MRLIIRLICDVHNQVKYFRAYLDVEASFLGFFVPSKSLMVPLLFPEIFPVLFDLVSHALVAFPFELFNLSLFLFFVTLSLDPSLLSHQHFALLSTPLKVSELVLLTLLLEKLLNK